MFCSWKGQWNLMYRIETTPASQWQTWQTVSDRVTRLGMIRSGSIPGFANDLWSFVPYKDSGRELIVWWVKMHIQILIFNKPEHQNLLKWEAKRQGWFYSREYILFVTNTVEPPLTATFFVPEDSPYIDSCLNLSTTATTKITSQQRPVFSATDESQEWSGNLIHKARRWLIAIVFQVLFQWEHIANVANLALFSP